MKIFILCILLTVGIYPSLSKTGIGLNAGAKVFAQDYGSEDDSHGDITITGGFLPNEYGTTETQVGNLCVPYTMEYIGDFFGIDIDPTGLAYEYANEDTDLYDSFFDNGIPYNQIETIAATKFNLSVVYDNVTNPNSANSDLLYGILDEGHPLMATYRDASFGLHEVMVTGYDPINGATKALNSQTGQWEYQDPGDYIKVIEVTGPKSP